jgi:hypothetical protein
MSMYYVKVTQICRESFTALCKIVNVGDSAANSRMELFLCCLCRNGFCSAACGFIIRKDTVRYLCPVNQSHVLLKRLHCTGLAVNSESSAGRIGQRVNSISDRSCTFHSVLVWSG